MGQLWTGWLDFFKDIMLITFFIVIGSLIGYSLAITIYADKLVEYMDRTPAPKPNTNILTGEPLPATIQEWQNIGKDFAKNHDYSTEYNCVNFSKDFAAISRSLGYKVSEVTGCSLTNTSECHMWLQISYEPQSGEFVDYSEKYPNQTVIRVVGTN